MTDQFRRKTPEELLRSIHELERGRLKIILGAVSGSGKTYHMLLEGNSLMKKGIDTVIGMISASNRPKTEEKIGSLEIIEPIRWKKGEENRVDLDVEAILARNPEVVLVDNLAQRNRPGAKNPNRLGDVMDLIRHKISVITTVNIYELGGAREVAEKLTGVKVKIDNCLPDHTLAKADEVKLLDVTPEAILKRLQEGCLSENGEQDSRKDKLFNSGNLFVLRELSLRFLAGEVNEDLDDYRVKHGLTGASGASERILVPVQYHWNGSILIRRGHQIAQRLGGDLLVVCFRSHTRRLSKDEATFKRAIKKLCEKLEAGFEELPILKGNAAEEIVSYSTEKNVTRIVIGHSKKTRWEEMSQGSIVHQILKKTKNADIFIVADRAEIEGERVLPAKQKETEQANPYHRLSQSEMEKEIRRMKKGTHKVYIGAAPGVGKTYTMLREANELKKEGLDIVIGLLETHGRAETLEQVGSLEIIPRKQISYKNVVLEEMDKEAIMKRNPEVVLIDELAHTNVPGSENQKRYQDVEEILNAGISVISTMNIQHLESLNDSVEQITGVRVRETVPDRILRLSNEIELIDISPKALRERMREGNIYAAEKVHQALNHFFKTGNLIALRELALREVADDVDERLESMERKNALRGPWRKQEIIFVCINLNVERERMIRRGFRIAYRLKAEWYVLFVRENRSLTAEEEKNLQKARTLTERLGGVFIEREGAARRQTAGKIADILNEKKATQVIIGQSSKSRLAEWQKGSVVSSLLRMTRHLDVLVVADQMR